MNGALQIGGEAQIEVEAGVLEGLARIGGFFPPLGGQLGVVPAAEFIFFVVFAFAVAKQD